MKPALILTAAEAKVIMNAVNDKVFFYMRKAWEAKENTETAQIWREIADERRALRRVLERYYEAVQKYEEEE